MTTPNPEDRLRAALSARAASARPSPDALDGVFTKVSRHRRNARFATAGAGTALAVAAGVLVVSGGMQPERDRVVPASPTAEATALPSPTQSASPAPAAYAKDRAIVALRDGRLVEVSTTTGDVVRQIGNAPGKDKTKWNAASVSWSADRESLVVVQGCIIMLVDVDDGLQSDLGNGHEAVISPDGRYVASRGCEEDNGNVNVLDLRTGKAKTFVRPDWTPETPGYGMPDIDSISVVTELDWYDADSLVVTRNYEGAEEALLLDVATDDELDDGERLGVIASSTARAPGRLSWSNTNSGTAKVSTRPDGGRETLLFERDGVTRVAYDARGALLFVDGRGLWRWDAAGATLLVENAVQVAG